MPAKLLEFWFDFASTYAYLSALRIEALAAPAGVSIAFRPFLLGPIFKAQGWTSSPFNLYPAKGHYMVRDIERLATDRGHRFVVPEPFPQNSILAARLALIGLDEGWGHAFIPAVFRAEFETGGSIADAAALAPILRRVGADPAAALERAATPEIKDRLRAQTDAAMQHGIFGAPTFRTTDGEVFWGDDRLEFAVKWAQLL
jgi:2-hydroxychromene-2-carboxylate isomerase